MTAPNIIQPIFLKQKITQLLYQKHYDKILFLTGTYFMPHFNAAKNDLEFVYARCLQPEEFPSIFIETLKNLPV